MRVIVDEDGKVVTATSEDPGPSRYFEQLSLEAAKKWKFAPAATRFGCNLVVQSRRSAPEAIFSLPNKA